MLSAAVFMLTALVSLSASRLMVRAGITDIPVDRSNHTVPTPTAGGIGVFCGLAVGFLGLSVFGLAMADFTELPGVLSLCFAVALVGLYDDLYTPPTSVKFGIFIGIALLLIYTVGPVRVLPVGAGVLALPLWFGVIGTLLWIFVVTNGVNFMDGANGFMPGCMVIAFAGLAALAHQLGAPQTFWMSLISSAAWLGFLPWNFRRKALIFSGDIGALTAGFMFAVAVLLLTKEAASPIAVYAGALIMLPFLADVLLTLLWRAKRKQPLLSAHRDHLYQRAIKSGMRHQKISLIYYGAFTLSAVWAYALVSFDMAAGTWAFIAAIMIAALLYGIGHKVWRVS